jgi:hypothetical protein
MQRRVGPLVHRLLEPLVHTGVSPVLLVHQGVRPLKVARRQCLSLILANGCENEVDPRAKSGSALINSSKLCSGGISIAVY